MRFKAPVVKRAAVQFLNGHKWKRAIMHDEFTVEYLHATTHSAAARLYITFYFLVFSIANICCGISLQQQERQASSFLGQARHPGSGCVCVCWLCVKQKQQALIQYTSFLQRVCLDSPLMPRVAGLAHGEKTPACLESWRSHAAGPRQPRSTGIDDSSTFLLRMRCSL